MNPHDKTIDPAILREAADWLMRLHAGDAGPAEWEAVERWRASSPAHGAAWQRAETLLGELRRIPSGPVRAALERPGMRRRRLLRLIWLPALPVAWLAWRHHEAGGGERWQSATGKQRLLTLADGTRVLLNTDSEIAVRFDTETRLIRLLHGEILVTSAPDPQPVPRPLIVATANGTARPIGTRFSVRRTGTEENSRVTVFEGVVEIEAGGRRQRLGSGQRIEFGASGIGRPESTGNAVDDAWINGMIVARNMRLADLIAELDRYRPGLLRCDPAVTELRVSGTYPALKPERSLALLAGSFPLRINYRTRYWATVEPA